VTRESYPERTAAWTGQRADGGVHRHVRVRQNRFSIDPGTYVRPDQVPDPQSLLLVWADGVPVRPTRDVDGQEKGRRRNGQPGRLSLCEGALYGLVADSGQFVGGREEATGKGGPRSLGLSSAHENRPSNSVATSETEAGSVVTVISSPFIVTPL